MIIFADHSLLKLKQRMIPKRFAIETIESPDHIGISRSDRQVCFKKFNKLYLKVVCKNEAGNVIIITQHWVEKIN